MTDVLRASPLAVVTGASSGIGEEIAAQLARRGYDLVLVARRADRLHQLAARVQDATGVRSDVVEADLADRAECERLCEYLQPQRSRLEILVNNAGFGTHGYFTETSLDRELEMIDVNCAAPVYLTKRLLPGMLDRGTGYVLNVASMSSFTPGPVMAMYYATKAFLLSLSEALWEECRGTGVVVTALCPGPVRTEFQGTAGIAPGARSSGAAPIPVEEVARSGLVGMFRGDRVVIPGYQNRFAAAVMRFMPRTRLLKTVRGIQDARRRHTLEMKAREVRRSTD